MTKSPRLSALNCRELEGFILEYLEGGLSPTERREFELHLSTCSECSTYLEAYEATVALGKSVFSHPEAAVPDSVPEDLVAAILAARNLGP